MADRKLIVEVVGDSRSLERTFARSSNASKVFGRELTGNLGKADAALQRLGAGRAALLGGAAGAGVGIIAPKVIDQLNLAVTAASDLNEQISKTQQVFKTSSGDVLAWSSTTAKAIGVSRTAALEAVGTFGNLFAAIGVGAPEAAKTSERLVQLAADLASFNNADPSDVLDAIRSGLIGEAEPLRRYGVLLSEARVQQEAMAATGKDNVKSLTDQEKAAARVAIIFRDTSTAQGDFARTSGSLANQQRVLAAQTADLQSKMGRLLLPVMQEMTEVATAATGAMLNLTDALFALGRVKIPEIKIPFVVTVGGQSVGGLAGSALNFAKFTPLNPLFGITIAKAIADRIADQFDDASKATTPELANAFARSINTMTQNALDTAAGQVTPPKAPPAFGQPGFQPIDTNADQILGALDKAIEFFGDAAKKGAAAAKVAVDAKNAQDKAEEATRKQRESFSNLIAAIQLGVDRAAETRGFQDDLRRNTQLQNAIKNQIEVEGRTTDLAAQLFRARQDRARIMQQIADQAGEAEQARQFRALGLTAEGGPRTPTIANLRKQLEQLTDRLGGDVTPKIAGQLARIGKVLRDPIHKATEETRRAIVGLFDTIRGEFANQSGRLDGPLTRTSALNANRILEGLGLSRDMEKELRARLSQFNSAGLATGGRPSRTAFAGAAATPIVINTTVELDRQAVGQSTKRFLLNDRRHNPPQKRGPNAG